MKHTLALLTLVIVGAIVLSAQSSTKSTDSPGSIVENFLVAVMNGDLQTPGGWRQAGGFFAHPSSMPQGQPVIVIGTDSSTQEQWVRGNHAEVVITYRELGRIDSSLRFHQPLASPRQISVKYELIRAGASGATGTANGSGPRQWRIQNGQRFVWTGTVAAAQYVSEARANTTNPVTRKNADRTLSELRKLE